MKTTQITLEEAVLFAIEAHRGQLDKQGTPYISHPLRVATHLRTVDAGEDAELTGLFHDVLEDTRETPETMVAAGVPERVVVSVKIVSKNYQPEGLSYQERIDYIIDSGDEPAILAKYADVNDNLSPERVESLPEEAKGLPERYRKAKIKLEQVPVVRRVFSLDS